MHRMPKGVHRMPKGDVFNKQYMHDHLQFAYSFCCRRPDAFMPGVANDFLGDQITYDQVPLESTW